MKIFDCSDPTAAYRGFASYPAPLALPNGVFSLGQNVRADGGSINLRGTTDELTTSAPGGGTFISGALFPTGTPGEMFVVACIEQSSARRLYGCIYSSSAFGAWAELTEASGKYGATRFGTTGKTVTFAGAPSTGLGLTIVAQDGVGYPRIFSSTTVAADSLALAEPITAPTIAQAFSPQYGVSASLTLSFDFAATTVATNGGNVTWDTGGATYDFEALRTGATAVAGDWVDMTMDAQTFDASAGSQVWIIATPTDLSWVTNTKIELTTGGAGTQYTVHDPSVADNHVEISVQGTPSGQILYGFPVTSAVGSGWKGVRLTCVNNDGIAASSAVAILGIAAGGQVPGTADYAVAWRNSQSKQESAGVVLPATRSVEGTATLTPTGLYFSTWPGYLGGTDMVLPISPDFYYSVKVPVFSPSSTDSAKGVDYMDVYRRDPGELEYTYVTTQQTTEYTAGNWVYHSPFTGYNQKQTLTDNTAPENKNKSQRAPDGANLPCPVGLAQTFASRRLFVGTTQQSSSTARYASVMYSEQDRPFRFRQMVRSFDEGGIDQVSGSEARIGAGETVQMVFATSSSYLGLDNVYAVSDRTMYALDGLEVRRLGSVGASGPFAWAEWGGSAMWLDAQRVMRTMGASIGQVSRTTVHDKLTAIPSAALVRFNIAYYRDRFYAAYSTTGSTNDRVLVWSSLIGAWESDDTFNASVVTPQQFVVWQDGLTDKLCFFGSAGKLYQYETTNSQDEGGYDVPFKLTSKEWAVGKGNAVKLGQLMGMYCTAQAGKTATITRTSALHNTTETTSAIPLTVTTVGDARVYRNDLVSGVTPGNADVSMQLTLDATVSYPWRLYLLEAELEPRSSAVSPS